MGSQRICRDQSPSPLLRHCETQRPQSNKATRWRRQFSFPGRGWICLFYFIYFLNILLQIFFLIFFFNAILVCLHSFYVCMYVCMAVLGLRFCARAFSGCGKRGPLFIAVRGPLTIAASLVAEHRFQTRRLSSCGSRA